MTTNNTTKHNEAPEYFDNKGDVVSHGEFVAFENRTLAMVEWRTAQQDRFTDREYVKVNWNPDTIQLNPCHYAHVSTNDESKIAFTASEIHGLRDRRTAMRPGKYLTKYHPELTLTDIERITAMWVPHELHIARTADEIEDAYTNGKGTMMCGVNACMSYNADHYAGSEHPVRVYGSAQGVETDFALAYLTNDEGETIARSIIRTDVTPNVYTRVYGDYSQLKGAMLRAGLCEESGDFEGGRVRRIECSGGYVLPYIDGYGVDYCNEVDSHHFELAYNGEFDCSRTDGVASVITCSECHEAIDTDNGSYIVNNEEVCCECATSCELCGECVLNNDIVQCIGIRRYIDYACSDCVNDNTTECEECSAVVLNDKTTEVDGDSYCDDCLCEVANNCEECGDYHKHETMREVVTSNCDYHYCEDCFDKHTFECVLCETAKLTEEVCRHIQDDTFEALHHDEVLVCRECDANNKAAASDYMTFEWDSITEIDKSEFDRKYERASKVELTNRAVKLKAKKDARIFMKQTVSRLFANIRFANRQRDDHNSWINRTASVRLDLLQRNTAREMLDAVADQLTVAQLTVAQLLVFEATDY